MTGVGGNESKEQGGGKRGKTLNSRSKGIQKLTRGFDELRKRIRRLDEAGRKCLVTEGGVRG